MALITKSKQKAVEEFLSIAETAGELRKSNDFVRDEITRRRMAYHRFDWRILIARSDLDAYLQRTRVAALGEH